MDNAIFKKRLLSMFALARKAGKLTAGAEGCQKAMRAGTAYLVHVSRDASANTRKKFGDKANFYKAPIYSMFTKEEINRHIGLAGCATFVVTDQSFATKIIEIIEETMPL
ncbi:MAG: ribosomal L7Ae/L30e/S12e/Gadd45 family protein [Clostridiales bacterium]|jgi:ribosomal protein L7Ae-like RNA K-turn-binding protein|nr:ribosomal L7Ae/L30e/S12e/Gadd45 family protein [Clostridiales bacterium]